MLNDATRPQYLALNLGTIEVKHTEQSLYRRWNRLHRLQKTLVIIISVLFVLYIISHVNFHTNSLKNISNEHRHEEIRPRNDQKLSDHLNRKKFKYNQRNRKIFKGPTNERQQKVVDAFKHAWQAYREHAWGKDEYMPISQRSSSWFNLGLTIVDSLDTIYIMNLMDEFHEARDWVEESLDFNVDNYNNLFELTIRIMGGLLSSYHLSHDKMFLEKAYEMGNRSINAFKTESSIPLSDVNLKRSDAKSPHWTSDSSLSEVATLQVEYRDLSRQTGDQRFETAAFKVSQHLHTLEKKDGLLPIYINTRTGKLVGSTITLGARGDSYYEYLLKQWIQTGASFDRSSPYFFLLEDWLTAVRGIREHLVRYSQPNGLTFVGELIGGSFSPKMDHLVCFLPGNLALGASYLQQEEFFHREANDIMELARNLTECCNQMYAQMETGLSPEIVYFQLNPTATKDIYVKEADRHNLLRPETIESLYYMYKFTNDKKYQDYGWKMFEAFETYTKVDKGGYTSISDVTRPDNVRPRDKMESFFLAETLKYFYLLFEDETNENINLNEWIINTEAHLIPIKSL